MILRVNIIPLGYLIRLISAICGLHILVRSFDSNVSEASLKVFVWLKAMRDSKTNSFFSLNQKIIKARRNFKY